MTTPTQDRDNPYVWWIPSTSEPDKPRRVEIDAMDFWGDCFCAGHDAANSKIKGALTRHQKADKKIGKPSQTWCCHIKAARKHHIEDESTRRADAARAEVYDMARKSLIDQIKPR